MKEPTVCLCVQDDEVQPLKWILSGLNKEFHVTSFRSLADTERALNSRAWDLLILDADVSDRATVAVLQKLKSEKPELKTILIVPPVGSREMVLEIIQARMVNGLVVKPFTGEVVCKYVAKELGGTADQGPLGKRSHKGNTTGE
jgi:response regulator RpfG family c-di-GMP phosphodiesterase